MQQLVDAIVKVIVIGAGISGTGASLQLTKDNIQHIVIEGRDRIGGRIVAGQFDGRTVQLGASFVHNPNRSNSIADFMRKQGWNYTLINSDNEQYFYQSVGELNDTTIESGYELYEKICEYIGQKENGSTVDLSIEQAAKNYNENTQQEVKDVARWLLQSMGNQQGAELRDISAKICQESEDQDQLLPARGYTKLFQYIFSKTKPKEVRLNQKVTKIDYSGDVVKVYTQNNVYLAYKVISSLPLGVLQNNLVQFTPKLPESHQKVIQKLGNGVFNKIFVSFQEPFWDSEAEWINFVAKNGNLIKYPAAKTIMDGGKFILCVFVSGDAALQLSQLTDEQILSDFTIFLKRFFPEEDIVIKDLLSTRWHKDPFSLGSYSYDKVGVNTQDYNTLRSSIDNKIWFVGEHCHPIHHSYTHGAFETGMWSARQIAVLLK